MKNCLVRLAYISWIIVDNVFFICKSSCNEFWNPSLWNRWHNPILPAGRKYFTDLSLGKNITVTIKATFCQICTTMWSRARDLSICWSTKSVLVYNKNCCMPDDQTYWNCHNYRICLLFFFSQNNWNNERWWKCVDCRWYSRSCIGACNFTGEQIISSHPRMLGRLVQLLKERGEVKLPITRKLLTSRGPSEIILHFFFQGSTLEWLKIGIRGVLISDAQQCNVQCCRICEINGKTNLRLQCFSLWLLVLLLVWIVQ